MIESVSFTVAGVPIPQGSSRAFVVGGRAVVTSSNKNLAQWRQRIATEAQKVAVESGFYSLDKRAYDVHATFYFPRTKSLKKNQTEHIVRPDLDKLIRAINDGITNILIPDDSMINAINVRKLYLAHDSVYGPRVEVQVIKKTIGVNL